jgi:hypothetical protein
MRKLMIGGVMLLITVFTATTAAYTRNHPPHADGFKQEFLDYINTKRQPGLQLRHQVDPAGTDH